MTVATQADAGTDRARCTINLGALRHNVRTLEARLTGGARLWPVVKADAYGHGATTVARVLEAMGVERMCVATLSEARALRDAGVDAPLLILGPLPARSLGHARDLRAAVTVLSDVMVRAIIDRGDELHGLDAHLKIDTGMGRWGVPMSSAVDAARALGDVGGVQLAGAMTHFATADERDNFFDLQLSRFDDVMSDLRALHPNLVSHCANSAAVLRDPRAHRDAVRCGVAIYGLSPTQDDPASTDLRPVLELRSHVADLRTLAPGESTGYCRAYVASRHTVVALVPIGYADGIRRSLSREGVALVRGRPRRYAGNVSMDHVSLEVDDDVRIGDQVVLIGADGQQRVLAEDHARWADTINYEITCGIAREPRLRRDVMGGEA